MIPYDKIFNMKSHNPWLKKCALHYPINDCTLPFQDYIKQTQGFIQQYRPDLQGNQSLRIIQANSPFELYPSHPLSSAEKKVKYGILLIHGLFDAPHSLYDLGLILQKNGMLARSVLLPGHGIFPGCLLTVTHQDWQQAVRYGVASLAREAEHVFILGFSMGGTLALRHAQLHDQITGLILLAPCFQIKGSIDRLISLHRIASIVKNHLEWLSIEEEIDYTRYQSVPIQTIYELKNLLAEISLPAPHLLPPVFMIANAQDEIVSTKAAVQYFHEQLFGEKNRLLLYTSKETPTHDPRITYRSSFYPELLIRNFSHVCLPISPLNDHYGKNGDYLYASHPDAISSYGAMNRIEEQCYRWLYRHGLIKIPKKELTYNPDFTFLAEQIVQFIINSTH